MYHTKTAVFLLVAEEVFPRQFQSVMWFDSAASPVPSVGRKAVPVETLLTSAQPRKAHHSAGFAREPVENESCPGWRIQ